MTDSLFTIIKQPDKLNEVIKIIDINPNIDVNIRDNNNMYLIQYALMFNNIPLTKLLIERGAKIDMINSDGKTLLYEPIKYGYVDLINTILKYGNETIGISIIDLRDKQGYIPLQYSIIFDNINIFELLLNYGSNINIKDNLGNTSLHNAIMKKNIILCKEILKKDFNLKLVNNIGESALHFACNYELFEIAELLIKKGIDLNIYDNEFNLTALIYCIILQNIQLIDLLLSNNIDVTIQDINGNTSLHHAILENTPKIINKLIPYFDNLNYVNINGKTVAHLILTTLEENSAILDNINFDKILEKTDINIQDNDGNTVFGLLIKNNLLKNYEKNINTKMINIFIENKDNKNPYDIAIDKDYLINFISNNYLYNLRNTTNKNLLLQKWEKECKVKSDDNNCLDQIKKYITEKKISILTIKQNYVVNVPETKKVNFITYTGISLDIIFGIIFILQKNKKISVSTLTTNFMENKTISEYLTQIGVSRTYQTEYSNYEILWSYQKLFIPTNFEQIVNDFIKNNTRFLIIPLGIESAQGAHANILIYDRIKKEVERFEPNGSDFPFGFNYNPELLDNLLEQKLLEYFDNIKYVTPKEFLPKIGFQQLELIEHYKTRKIGDPGGFCSAWSIWYADMRLNYPNITREQLVINLIQSIKEKNQSFKNLIRGYTSEITALRDKYLLMANIEINDWINDNYTQEQFDKFTNILIELIKNL